MNKHSVSDVVNALIVTKSRVATKYISPKEVIRATRRTFQNKIHRGNIEVTLVIGRPNYLEREFIRQCQKVNEAFPVKKILLKPLKKGK